MVPSSAVSSPLIVTRRPAGLPAVMWIAPRVPKVFAWPGVSVEEIAAATASTYGARYVPGGAR